MQVSFTNLCLFSIFASYLICISDITHYVTKYHSKSLFNDHWIFLVKKFHGTFSRVPWNFLNNIWTTFVVPWNSMEFHGILSRSKVPWNSMELFPHSRVPWNSMEFHGTFHFPQKSSMEFHGIPLNFFWSSMEFHGIPWNLIKFIFKKIIFLNIVFGIWLMIRCYLAKISQKRYKLHWFQYRNSYFEHPSVSENGTRSAKMACCFIHSQTSTVQALSVEVWNWIDNFTPHFIKDVITYMSWDYNLNHVGKWAPVECGKQDSLDVFHVSINYILVLWQILVLLRLPNV